MIPQVKKQTLDEKRKPTELLWQPMVPLKLLWLQNEIGVKAKDPGRLKVFTLSFSRSKHFSSNDFTIAPVALKTSLLRYILSRVTDFPFFHEVHIFTPAFIRGLRCN